MKEFSPQVMQRLSKMVHQRNRELASDALLKAGLGIVFSCIAFGFVFWLGWFAGFFFGRPLNLHPWQFGAIFTSVYFIVATWSAWHRVDPMAGLKPVPDRQLLLRLIAHAAGVAYFSPRHASAGMALILLGGPANVFMALGIWAHRLRADESLLKEAAQLLASCQADLPAERVRALAAAWFLKRLALIKVVRNGESAVFKLTDKGFAVLGSTGPDKRRPNHV